MSYDYTGYGAPAPAADPYAAGGYAHPAYAPPPAFGGYGAPAPYGAPPQAAYGGGVEEVRTIFITGFPNDVKERELNNLLRFLPGYEASQMNWNKGQAQGFALFATAAYARGACDALQHVTFDEVSTLRCEVARKNMYIKDDPNKRPRTSGPPFGGHGGGFPPAGGHAPYHRSGPPSFQAGGSANNQGDNPPCNTLFVGNLSDAVDENEIRNLYAGHPGFKNFKLMRGPRATSAFVEFDEVAQAAAAHQATQGAMLNSSDRGGLRVQFSKNPFGKKRDVTGQLIDTPVRDPSAPSGAAGAGAAGGYGAPAGGYGGNGTAAGGAAGGGPEEYQPTAF